MSNDPSKFEFDDSEDASRELDFEDLADESPGFPGDFADEGGFTDEGDSDAMDDLAEAESTEEGSEGELAEDAADEEGAGEDAGKASDQPEDLEETDETEPKRRWWAVANWDLYTIMLGVSLLAVTIACLLLYLELQQYSPFPWWKTSGVVEGM